LAVNAEEAVRVALATLTRVALAVSPVVALRVVATGMCPPASAATSPADTDRLALGKVWTQAPVDG
jgi:hypothetical protein